MTTPSTRRAWNPCRRHCGGIGDGVESYSGVAPDADLYAIKVFGKDGSTMDATVIAGLEFAADPNRDLELSDYLHVVNLSLGGGFGQPQILYNEAVKNLTQRESLSWLPTATLGLWITSSAPRARPMTRSRLPRVSMVRFTIGSTPAVRLVSPNNGQLVGQGAGGLFLNRSPN